MVVFPSKLVTCLQYLHRWLVCRLGGLSPLLLILCISMYIAVKAGEHKIVAEIIASDGSVQIPRQTQTQRHAATPRSEADMQESGP